MNKEIDLNRNLYKNLNSIYKETFNEENLKEIKESFENLFNIYFAAKKWKEIFELVDQVNFLIKSKPIINFGQDDLMYIIGNSFYSIDSQLVAYEFFKKAVVLSKESNLLAVESLENLINQNIDRWHFRMLNDNIRNKSYKLAIEKKLDQLGSHSGNINVLDIGTGTGLLSAFCILSKWKDSININACELNEFFFEISQKFLSTLNTEHIKIINKHSNDLSKKDDLGDQMIDLIVTEIFDDCLLGENCLDTFYHAMSYNRLLKTGGQVSRVIPQSAKIYLAAIECDFLKKSNRFTYAHNNGTFEINCMDSSKLFKKNESFFEPYTTENLNKLDFKLICDPVELDDIRIEFDNLSFLEKYCRHNEVTTISKLLTAKTRGFIDGFVIWFDLYLDDDIALTNAPVNVLNTGLNSLCWHQAIYPNINRDFVEENDTIGTEITFRKDCLLVESKLDNIESIIDRSIKLDRMEIFQLNNDSYQDYYCNKFEVEFEKLICNKSGSTIKLGFYTSSFSRLMFEVLFKYKPVCKQDRNIDLVVEVFTHSVEDDYFNELLHQSFGDIVRINYLDKIIDGENTDMFEIDYLICQPIDVKYSIMKKNLISDLIYIQRKNSKKAEIFPEYLEIKGVCIQSELLANESQLTSNKNLELDESADLCGILCAYNIKHIYSVQRHDVSDSKLLSENRTILKIGFNDLDSMLELSSQKTIEFDVVNSGKFTHILYWFDFAQKVQREDSYSFNQFAAFSVIDQKLVVDSRIHSKIKINSFFKNSLLHLNFNQLINMC